MSLDPKISNPSSNTTQQHHMEAAKHCEAAASAHKEAIKHHTSGDVKQAGFHAAVAHGHAVEAHEHSEVALKKIAATSHSMK